MPTADQYTTTDTLKAGDKILAFLTSQGDLFKASITTLITLIQANLTNATCTTITASSYTKVSSVTVANLTAAATAGAGARATVTDATQALTAGIGAIVAGGGSNIVPVFCD